MKKFLPLLLLLPALAATTLPTEARGQDAMPDPQSVATTTAPVMVDGDVLFRLRGITSYPARERARIVRRNILGVARDDSIALESIVLRPDGDYFVIYAGEQRVLGLYEADAELEAIELPLLAEVILQRMVDAVRAYREDRSPAALRVSGLWFLALTGAALLLVWLLKRFGGWLDRQLERRVKKGIQHLERKSGRVFRSAYLWGLVQGATGLLRIVLLLLIAYFYVHSVLGAFPWTRGFARQLLHLVITPIGEMGRAFVDAIPGLVFLVILVLIVRFVLRIMRNFANAVERRQIRFPNFDEDWAQPTYKILRVVVIAFAVVVAYPYIPGSGSAAFKGVSLFLGVIVSLGSTSFISNMIAGLSMTYRGAYREGDWVRIGDTEGQVEEMRMMVMRLRTRKNESVTIPNSVILNSNVVNYSQRGATDGVILHTVVGIGYDTPWRQVEAMLEEAARRTEGVLQSPAPFVLQRGLGDFAIQYELNALTADAADIPARYTDLHRNILDVFNEHGVQIMSPAYETDPADPKIVPPDKWHAAPARQPGKDPAPGK